MRYKEGLAATGVSFCSDGSVLAVAYAPADGGGRNGGGNDNYSSRSKGQLQTHGGGQGMGKPYLPTHARVHVGTGYRDGCGSTRGLSFTTQVGLQSGA